jgi:uncharacterized damage-inducible protein DinB
MSSESVSNDSKYPIGRFAAPADLTRELLQAHLDQIAACPAELRRAVADLSPSQLDTPYREGGWTVRQVVHHLPDSHMNAYIRHKLAATEEQPTIRPYKEALWAELPDARNADPALSLALLDALHARWTSFLRAVPPEMLDRTFLHPDLPGPMSLAKSIAMYAWHGRHHVAQIDALRQRQRW